MAIINTINLIILVLTLSLGLFSIAASTGFYKCRKKIYFGILQKKPRFKLDYIGFFFFFIAVLTGGVALTNQWSDIFIYQIFFLVSITAISLTLSTTQYKIPKIKEDLDKEYILFDIIMSTIACISSFIMILVTFHSKSGYVALMIPEIGAFELLLPALIIAELISWLWFPFQNYSLALAILPSPIKKYLFSKISHSQFRNHKGDFLRIIKHRKEEGCDIIQSILPAFRHMDGDTIDKEIIDIFLENGGGVMHIMPKVNLNVQSYLLAKLH